ncbi:MAG: 50S ribosomal protein L18 [Deltaproteobacteria bacterium]|nr:50S ribosomal protein L18 [Deltaproteobacteria bacterium]
MKSRYERRKTRKQRIRNKISGTAERPRLSVFRSARHIYVQALDDITGITLASASTQDKDLREKLKSYSGNKNSATLVGGTIAARLKEKGIANAVFDRNGNLYHGRVKALADAAREAGLSL